VIGIIFVLKNFPKINLFQSRKRLFSLLDVR